MKTMTWMVGPNCLRFASDCGPGIDRVLLTGISLEFLASRQGREVIQHQRDGTGRQDENGDGSWWPSSPLKALAYSHTA